MKKFISMLLCLAMVLSLCAVTFAAETTSATISFDDAANRTVFTTEQQVWVQNGITVTNDKAASTSNVADYAKPARFYKNSKLTVAYPGMTVIEFECNTASYATALKNSITTGTATVNGKVVGVTLDAAADSYVIEALSGGQVRIDKITVYAGGAPVTPDEPVVVPATLAEQIAEANKLANKEYLPYQTTITGTITNDPLASSYTAGAYDFTVSDGTNSLRCYFVPVTGGTPAKGDTVTVTGYLTAYNGAAQFNETASATIVKKAEGGTPSTPETPEEPETPTAGAVANPVAGTAYKFALQQNGLSGKPLLGITGAMSGYYYATTETATEMVDVYLETVTGGYHIYFMDGTTKTYLDIIPRENDATKTNVVFQTSGEHTVYVLNTEFQYVMTTVNGTDWYLGTFGSNKTVSASKTSYIEDTSKIGVSQFCAWFYAAEGGTTPEQPEQPEPHEHDYVVTTTVNCTTTTTTYTCGCGHTYSEEDKTNGLGHIDENLDIDCDREGCTSKVVPAADSLLSNFTANCLGSKVSTDNKYYVQGTIVEVLDAKNGIFLIDDGTGERFYFRLPVNADGVSHANWAIKLTLGDKVKVYGKINKYSTSTAPNGQFWPAIQGGVVTVLEQHAHDFTYSPADCRNPAACVCGQTYGAPRGCVDADENNICDDCGKNTKYAYEYIEIRTDNNSGVHDATALTYTWSNGNFVVQVAKASGGNLYVTSNNHMRLYKNNQLVLTNKNGLTVKTIIVYLTNATQVSNFETMLTGYTYTKNETDFTITIEVDSFETLTLINSGSTTQIKGVEFGYERQETVDKAAADVVVAQINVIGTVTLDSRATIEAVRAAYEALTDAQKALVGNLATLEAAEEALQALQQQADKEAADKKAAGVVVALIEEIGTVTKDSKAAIDAARAAYDALTDAQKALVENYETLTKAEEAFKGIDDTGDNTMMFVAMAILSMTAVVALVSKKRAF